MQQAVQSQKTAYSRAEFAALHFTTDGEHVGYVGVYGKAAKTGQLYRILYCEADKLPEQLEELKLWNQDYYLTANTFTGGVRVSESLFTLQNIVLDVDCHDESLTPGKRQHLLDAFLYFLRADLFGAPDFLRPNTIVETGRGVQLWWAIQPVSKWKAQQYEAVREKLIERIQQLLADYPALHGLELDRGASHNAAGVFRLPGSYNSKTGKRGRFELIHEERLDILEETTGEQDPVHTRGRRGLRSGGHVPSGEARPAAHAAPGLRPAHRRGAARSLPVLPLQLMGESLP